MGDYVVPADVPISASWQVHRDRTPPSSEPGTDYAAAYGTSVAAPFGGTVIEIKTNNSGAMGRYVALALDDGRTARCLHLSQVLVPVGMWVFQGQIIAISGASGYGSDWYYGPHVHQTLWPTCYWCEDTIDFALYVGPPPKPEPKKQEMDMPGIRIHFQRFTNGNQAYVVETETGFYIPDSSYLAALVKAYQIDLDSLPALNEYDWNAVVQAKDLSNSGYPDAQPGGGHGEGSK